MHYPVVITSAIKPPKLIPHTEMTDPCARLAAVKCAVYYWVALGVKNIVFVDSTNTSPFHENDIRDIENCGVDLEILLFQQDDKEVLSFGKGFGEGKIISMAINNSHILNKSDYFYKITGKCFCKNFLTINELIIKNDIKNMFWRMFDRNFLGSDLSLIDTRFFFTSKSFYLANLHELYLSAKNISIERLIGPVLESRLTHAYSERAQISGFSGGTGGQYMEYELGYLEKNFPILLSV